MNLALAATATSNSTYSGYSPSKVNDGDTSSALGGTNSWSNENGGLPAWVQLDFGSAKRFGEVVIFTTQGYEIADYEVQYYDGSVWKTLAAVTANTETVIYSTFEAVTAQLVRVYATKGPTNQPAFARINELQVFDNQALDATVTASSTEQLYSVDKAHDGSRSVVLGYQNSWSSGPVTPAWLEFDFGACHEFSRVELFTSENYPLRDYDLEFWNGSAWQAFETVTGNTELHNTYDFPTIATEKVRVYGKSGPNHQPNYLRVNELEIF